MTEGAAHRPDMMDQPKLLLCALGRTSLILLGRALRDEGYVVLPARYHELGVDSLARVQPDVALVQVNHEAADSPEFAAMARAMGVKVFLFECPVEGRGDGASMHFDPDNGYPVLESTGDCRALAGLLRTTLSGTS